MPLTFLDQAIPRGQRKWNGDVWKSIVETRTKDEIFTCVGCFDQGIGMILKRKNDKKLDLPLRFKSNFKNLRYQDYFNNYKDYLNLVTSEKFFHILESYRQGK